MGTTKSPVQGCFLPPADVCVDRSPGPLGWNDAADPNVRACLAGDTPGPVGTGSDAAAAQFFSEPRSCDLPFPALAVDLNRMMRFVYTVTYAEETNRATTRGFAAGELQHGEEAKIEAAAKNAADGIMALFQESLARGPLAVMKFISELEERKTLANASLKEKYAEAQRVRNRWVSILGGAVKVLSTVKFGATVTIKTLSIVTGAAGTAIDIVYSGALAGNKQFQAPESGKTVKGVVIEESAKNVLQEVGEELNELVANGILTKEERNKFEGLMGNYKGNARKLQEQIANLEEKVRKAIEAGNAGKKSAGMSRQAAKKISALKSLREKTVSAAMRTGTRGALVKKAAGRTLSLVFLASEVRDAYRESAQEWRTSD